MKYKKGTFIVVPNKEYLKGKPAEMQTLFFWLCSYANDDGQCYPSRNRLAKDIGCTVKTIDKYMKLLIDYGLINKQTRKDGKENISNLYQIFTLGEENEDPTPSVIKDPTPSHPNDIVTVSIGTISNLTILQEDKLPVEAEEFYHSKELEKLQNSDNKYNKILALYFYRKNFNFENKLQFQTEYKRNIKVARELVGYNSKQIQATMEFCEEKWAGVWTLETVLKRINSVIANGI